MARIDPLAEPALAAFIERARVDCEYVLEYRCPLYWGDLDPTTSATTRFCSECQQNVYLVTSEVEFTERVARRECVAVVLMDELPSPEQARELRSTSSVMGLFA